MSIPKNSIWNKIPSSRRNAIVWWAWFVTWIYLVIGLFDHSIYEDVVLLTLLHAAFFLVCFRFQFKWFPVQLRFAYLLWVAVGTYVPGMVILMYITTVGLAVNLAWGYCPLARIMYLLPWNREQKFSWPLVKRVFLSPPVKGKFQLSK